MSKSVVPAERISKVEEYYFSIKLKEIAKMNAEGAGVINLGIGSPDMPPTLKERCLQRAQWKRMCTGISLMWASRS